ncbi:NAD(P)-binding protein [Camillea tinctor]|nr:NAD(P)-binding protein [Camillea tinctor]
MASTPSPSKSVLVTGANGYIGNAVCRAFRRAGWHVYGLVRRSSGACALAASEIIPVVGSVSADLSWLDALLGSGTTFDAVVSCTENFPFAAHYAHILALLTRVAQHNRHHGRPKPLVLFSSGCKDYGTTPLHGSDRFAPHLETTPLDPPAILRERAACALDALAHPDLFDAAVVRPTPVYGYGSSYYATFFQVVSSIAAAASQPGEGPKKKIRVPADLNTVIHGCHVDDCGEAYVALATHADRGAVAGQCFNVSGRRYETLGELLGALGGAYGISFPSLIGDVVVVGPLGEGEEQGGGEAEMHPGAVLQLGYSQWVGSDKIRRLTGWTDTRTLLSEDARAYRAAYEAAVERGDEGVARIQERVAGTLAGDAAWKKSGVYGSKEVGVRYIEG